MTKTPQEILADPQFQALPLEERRKVLLTVDSKRFGALPMLEQNKVLGVKQPPVAAPAPAQEAPSIFSDERMGKYFDPLETVKKIAVDPFDKMAAGGKEIGANTAEYTARNKGARVVASIPLVGPAYTMYKAQQQADSPEAVAYRAEHPIEAGIARGVGGVGGGMVADPRNWPLVAMGPSRALAGAFAAQMGHGAVQGAKQLGSEWDNPEVSQSTKIEHGTEATLGAAMAGLSGAHAVMPGPKAPVLPAENVRTTSPTGVAEGDMSTLHPFPDAQTARIPAVISKSAPNETAVGTHPRGNTPAMPADDLYALENNTPFLAQEMVSKAKPEAVVGRRNRVAQPAQAPETPTLNDEWQGILRGPREKQQLRVPPPDEGMPPVAPKSTPPSLTLTPQATVSEGGTGARSSEELNRGNHAIVDKNGNLKEHLGKGPDVSSRLPQARLNTAVVELNPDNSIKRVVSNATPFSDDAMIAKASGKVQKSLAKPEPKVNIVAPDVSTTAEEFLKQEQAKRAPAQKGAPRLGPIAKATQTHPNNSFFEKVDEGVGDALAQEKQKQMLLAAVRGPEGKELTTPEVVDAASKAEPSPERIPLAAEPPPNNPRNLKPVSGPTPNSGPAFKFRGTTGDTVTFSRVPPMSYLKAGEPYTINTDGNPIKFTAADGSGAFHKLSDLRNSEFQVSSPAKQAGESGVSSPSKAQPPTLGGAGEISPQEQFAKQKVAALEKAINNMAPAQDHLTKLMAEVEKSFPPGAARLSKLLRYEKALERFGRGLERDDADMMAQAYDIARGRERGSISNRPDPREKERAKAEELRQKAGLSTSAESAIKELTGKVAQVSDSKPRDAKETALAQVVDSYSRGKDTAQSLLEGTKAASQLLWDKFAKRAPWTEYREAVGKFSGDINYAGDFLRKFAIEIRKHVPNPGTREALTNFIQANGDMKILQSRAAASTGKIRAGYEAAMHLSSEEQTFAKGVRDYFDRRFVEAQNAGLLEHAIENYVNQTWKKPNKVTRFWQAAVSASVLQPKPSFARQRVFDSFFEGEQAGFKPLSKDIGFLVANYELAFSKALASRNFIKSLQEGVASDGRPIVAPSGKGSQVETPGSEANFVHPHARGEEIHDYRYINHPALRKWTVAGKDLAGAPIFQQGDLLVHPEYADAVHKLVKPSVIRQHPAGRLALRLSGEFKQTMLSLALFHQVQEGFHAVWHGISPLPSRGTTGNFFRPINGALHLDNNIAELNLDLPLQRNLVDHGLQVADFEGMQYFSEGVHGGGLVNRIPILGAKLHEYTDYLFRDYIPRLKMTLAIEAYHRNIDRYAGKLNHDQILELTSEQANAAFGELNYKMLGRSQSMQDALRLTLLAPDFLEARARFAGQAVKGIAEPIGKLFGDKETGYGAEQARALFIKNTIGVYVAARILNTLVDDDPHWDKPFSLVVRDKKNPENSREYTLRSVAGDIVHGISDPRNFTYHRLNPLYVRTGIEAATGRDEYGQPRSMYEQAKDMVLTGTPLAIQGKIRKSDESWFNSMLNSLGVSNYRYRSSAERAALEDAMKIFGDGFQEQTDRWERRKQLQLGYKEGTVKAADIDKVYQAGQLSEDDYDAIFDSAEAPTDLVRHFKLVASHSPSEALRIFKLANDEEKGQLEDILADTADGIYGKYPPQEERELEQKFEEALSWRKKK